jgi:hypothetical protein
MSLNLKLQEKDLNRSEVQAVYMELAGGLEK